MKINKLAVVLAAVLLAGITLAATPALRLNGLKFGTNDGSVWVTAYGAVGDGATDSTSAIQSAITAAATGATIHIPNGVYKLSGSGTELLLVNHGVHIECDGWGSVLQVASTVPNTTDIVHVTTPSASNLGFTMKNCSLQPVLGSTKAITAATNATPIQITATGHGYSTGNTVTISGVGGNTNANGTFVVTVVDANNFTLNGSAGNAAYTSGGTAAFVPGRHGVNLDVDAGNILANVKLDHNYIGQFGGRAIKTTNTASLANGIFLVDIVDNRLFGGINLSHAGDSILIRGNTITGGFNGIDIDSVSGAVQNAFLNNNFTGQGAFVVASRGGGLTIEGNNVEPGATGGYGVDNSNNANNAVIDIRGSVGNPIVIPIIRGNNLTNWSNWSTNGDVVRVDYGLGARIEANDIKRAAAGPFNYKITANAVGTQIRIPVGTDSGNYTNQVSNASTTTTTVYENQAAQQFFTTDNLGTGKNANVILSNPTAATAGATVQDSPFLEFDSNAWNSSSLVSQNSDWQLGSVPVSLAGTPFGAFSIYSKTAGGGQVQQWFVTNAGNSITTGNVYAGGSGGTGTVLAGTLTIAATTFASLGTPANGNFKYCSDCTVANPCAGGGTGALAKRLNGVWVCN